MSSSQPVQAKSPQLTTEVLNDTAELINNQLAHIVTMLVKNALAQVGNIESTEDDVNAVLAQLQQQTSSKELGVLHAVLNEQLHTVDEGNETGSETSSLNEQITEAPNAPPPPPPAAPLTSNSSNRTPSSQGGLFAELANATTTLRPAGTRKSNEDLTVNSQAPNFAKLASTARGTLRKVVREVTPKTVPVIDFRASLRSTGTTTQKPPVAEKSTPPQKAPKPPKKVQ